MDKPTQPRPHATRKARALDAHHLTSVRGGGLGITVRFDEPPAPIMPQQHNETLVRGSP